tara:strand:+ start:914 stop:1048 length:135 start_codon:yes stop_codon:yes gene_type:complete
MDCRENYCGVEGSIGSNNQLDNSFKFSYPFSKAKYKNASGENRW